MTLKPLAPDVWDQALINGRIVHPSDDAAALGWAMAWYGKQGGRFDGPVIELQQEAAPVEEPKPEPKVEKPRRSRTRHHAHKPVEEKVEEVAAMESPVCEMPVQEAPEEG